MQGSLLAVSSPDQLATDTLPGLFSHVWAQDLSVYGATKAAVQTLSIMAAKELGQRGIRVNSVAPGVIPTDMSCGAFPPGGYEQMEAQTKQLTPLEH
jgi:NAD(P)-dependent dehydrogenase (short-subunit alcohol dehydrogenase family)